MVVKQSCPTVLVLKEDREKLEAENEGIGVGEEEAVQMEALLAEGSVTA